jgi:hypothetical protein
MLRTTWTHRMALALALASVTALAQVGSPARSAAPPPARTTTAPLVAKTVYVPPSEDEQLSRSLLELKSQRAEAAKKSAPDDATLRDLDAQILALQQELGSRNAGSVDSAAEPVANPVYPRIAQTYPPPGYAGGETVTTSALADDSASDAAIRRALATSVVSFRCEAQPLEKCLREFGEKGLVNVVVNWRTLQEVNVDRNTPVTLNLVAVNGEKALKTILAQASPLNLLGYTANQGVLDISTKEDLSGTKYQVVKVIDVRDLLQIDTSAYPALVATQLRQRAVTDLMDTIKCIVAPDTWKDSGGNIGSIRELNGQLIINQTMDNQQAVLDLLAQLRTVKGKPNP